MLSRITRSGTGTFLRLNDNFLLTAEHRHILCDSGVRKFRTTNKMSSTNYNNGSVIADEKDRIPSISNRKKSDASLPPSMPARPERLKVKHRTESSGEITGKSPTTPQTDLPGSHRKTSLQASRKGQLSTVIPNGDGNTSPVVSPRPPLTNSRRASGSSIPVRKPSVPPGAKPAIAPKPQN
eukprot:Pgem_evm1s19683